LRLKKPKLGDGAQANHLAYLGDADIGAKQTSVLEQLHVIMMEPINIKQP
jgi:hypothetical protein